MCGVLGAFDEFDWDNRRERALQGGSLTGRADGAGSSSDDLDMEEELAVDDDRTAKDLIDG